MQMDPAMTVAVVSAVITAAGPVLGAWIQANNRRPLEQAPPGGAGSQQDGGVIRGGKSAGRELPPDDRW
jgi:hypothetical protein